MPGLGASRPVGARKGAAVGEGGVGVGQLQGGDQDLELADGGLGAVPGEPVRPRRLLRILLVILGVTGGVGIRPAASPGKVILVGLPNPYSLATLCSARRRTCAEVAVPELGADGVEVDVAGLGDGGLRSSAQASPLSLWEKLPIRILRCHGRGMSARSARSQAGGGGHQLERRAGAYSPWMARSSTADWRPGWCTGLVVGLADTADEVRRVVVGVGSQGQDGPFWRTSTTARRPEL